MSEFEKWYYTSDKCDNRFDNWTENRHSYYYSKEAWDHQQKIIDLQDEIIKVFHNRSDYENEKDLQEELAPLRDKLKGLRE